MLTNPIPLGFPSVSSCFMLPPPLPVTSCHNTTRYPEKNNPSFGVHTLCLQANPTPKGGGRCSHLGPLFYLLKRGSWDAVDIPARLFVHRLIEFSYYPGCPEG